MNGEMPNRGSLSEETNKDYGIIQRSFVRAVKNVGSELETLTRNIDSYLSGLKARQMPEYQSAIDAINNYAEVIGNKIRDDL